MGLYWLFLLHLAATLFMLGLIWFMQLVHYPLLAEIEGYKEAAYEFTRLRQATWVFAPPMLIEAATGIAMLLSPPPFFDFQIQVVGMSCLAVIWLMTLMQAAKHQRIATSFEAKAHRALVRLNWIRTLAWSLRAGIVLYVLAVMCSATLN